MNTYKIDVNIVDDHTMFSEALAEAINRSEEAHVSRTFTTLEACSHTLAERRPDVLLLDISMPDGNGIAFCQQMLTEYPMMKVVAITYHDEYSIIRRMLDSGVHGYVLKNASVRRLLDAIVRVYHGEQYIDEEVQNILNRGEASTVFLTNAERDILCLICEGCTNPQIAKRLSFSTETVNWYRKRLLAKFNVSNTVSLVTIALREHLL